MTMLSLSLLPQNVIDKDFIILGDIVRVHGQKTVSRAFVRAGVRPTAFFDPHHVKAAVVTCGGLCPGLNNVIRQIVLDLKYLYGVTSVFGIRCVLFWLGLVRLLFSSLCAICVCDVCSFQQWI